ncbi:CHAT domain-containing protein [Rhodovulum euryhalinum]|uniref:CHAT domain-containing protein n=1 Tax=Rhodovulum euryhalinum TaxID=35805 RepID=A0A4R2KPV7_9RHOB|nr:CHAT domain-containing protein [Rhodovulum euryhalinum]TCO72118.1 CHAT domain-containing protein [Rhodovulum euryhalinum]
MSDPLHDWLSTLERSDTRSQALAALGCLEAVGALSSGRDIGAALADLARTAGSRGADWQMPPPARIAAGLPSVADLALAWRAAFADTTAEGPVRLLLHPADAGWSPAETAVLPAVLDTLLAPLEGLAPFTPWREAPREMIAAASVLRPDRFPRVGVWDWPLVIGAGDAAWPIDWGAFPPIQRGIARLGRPGQDCDIAVLPAGLPAGSVFAGIVLAAAPPGTPFEALFGQPAGDASLVAWLRGGAPDAELLTALIYELAHDAPPDLALNWAARIAGQTPLPYVFSTAFHAEEMARARLSARLRAAARRLVALGRDDRDPLPDDLQLWALGIGEDNSRDPAALGAAIEQALARGKVLYDAESMAGEALARLEIELRRREPVPSAGVPKMAPEPPLRPRPSITAPAPEKSPPPRESDRYLGGASPDFSDFGSSLDDSFGPAADSATAGDGLWEETTEAGTDAAEDGPQESGQEEESAPDQADAEPEVAQQTAPQDPAPEETPRETDVALLRGHFYPGDAVPDANRLTAAEPLVPGSKHTLEVAIRARRIGITGAPSKPVQSPRKGREDVTVYVALSGPGTAALAFEDSLLPLTWPFDQDSAPAFFRFRSPAILPDPLSLSIRLYTADLRLLDLLELRREGGIWATRRAAGTLPPLEPDAGPDRDVLALHIRPEPLGFGVEAIVRRDGETRLAAPLGRTLLTADVEALLARVRQHWTALVIGKMSERKKLSKSGFRTECFDLRKLGEDAWRVLFGDRRGADAGAAETLGEMLRAAPLPDDAALRVTFEPNAESFAFPWAILAEPTPRGQPPNPDGLWGLRYRIELLRPQGRRPPAAGTGPVRILATLDKGFAGVVNHAATLDRVAGTGAGATILPATTLDQVLDALESAAPPEIIYFFCHGIAASRAAPLGADVIGEIRGLAENLGDDDRKPWTAFLNRLDSAGAGARLFTGDAEISEADLRAANFFRQPKRPLVFVNACQSADLLPGVSSGLTGVFLDRQAVAVIGTECPVTAIFADAFAGALLPRLLNGEPLGAAMLAVRRAFHQDRNPLALLYTLYGRGDARITAPEG